MRDIHDKKHNFIIAHAVYYAVRADFNSKKGHSAGIGATQDLLDGDASIGQIMVKVGWSKVDTVRRYVGVTSIAAMSSRNTPKIEPAAHSRPSIQSRFDAIAATLTQHGQKNIFEIVAN